MRIAVYCNNREWTMHLRSGFRMCEELVEPLEVDYLLTEDQFLHAVGETRYDLLLICAPLRRKVTWGTFLQEVNILEQRLAEHADRHTWKFGSKSIFLAESEIYCVISVRRAVSIYTEKGSYRISSSMKQAQEELSGGTFLRIHRNCLVNLEHVQGMEGNQLILSNGMQLTVSCRKRKEVWESLTNRMKK